MLLRALLLLAALAVGALAALKDGECEVCLGFLKEIEKRVGAGKSDVLKTEEAIDKFCDKPPTVRARVWVARAPRRRRRRRRQPVAFPPRAARAVCE